MNPHSYWIFLVDVSAFGKVSKAEAFVRCASEAQAKIELERHCSNEQVGLIRYTKKFYSTSPHHDPRLSAIFDRADANGGLLLNILAEGAIDPRNN